MPDLMAVATFEATEAAAWIVFMTLVSLKSENNYFDNAVEFLD